MPGSYFYERIYAAWSATGADTDGGGVTVTKTAETGKRHVAAAIQCSGDKACLVTIESPASTVLWRKRVAGAFTMSETFEPGTVVGADGGALLVKLSDGTTNAEANLQGWTIDS